MAGPLVKMFMLGLALVLGGAAAPAPAQEIMAADGSRIEMNVSEAKFIRLGAPASAVFLSNPGVAEIDLQSARYLYVVGRAVGETTLFVLDAEDEPMLRTTISVGIDTARLAAAARAATGGGAISVSTVEGALFLTGRVRSHDDAVTAEDVVARLVGGSAVIVNRLELETAAQVNLQVKIAEVSRSIREDLGISLTGSGGGSRRFAAPPTGIAGGFEIAVRPRNFNINLVLDALAETGLVTILSEPNLTARSGEVATFLAGGQVPFRTGATADDTRVEFETIGVELEFTPTVYDASQIQIELKTRVREIDSTSMSQADDIGPTLRERSASTTVEIGSGQSFAIAGMFRSDTQQSLTGFPGLVNLPVIGALFRSSRFARGETELVIIVTPYLVEPTDPRALSTPVDGFRPVGGIEQSITGRFSAPVRPGQQPGRSRVRGGAGFLLQGM